MASTVFEEIWNSDTPFIYRNETLGVGALPDAFPKFPDQVVIIPAAGFPDREQTSVSDLLPVTQLALAALEAAIQRKMEHFSGVPGVRGIVRKDGFAVPHHPHIVMFPALRGESTAYTEPPRPAFTGKAVRKQLVARTLENLRLTPEEVGCLDILLARISRL